MAAMFPQATRSSSRVSSRFSGNYVSLYPRGAFADTISTFLHHLNALPRYVYARSLLNENGSVYVQHCRSKLPKFHLTWNIVPII